MQSLGQTFILAAAAVLTPPFALVGCDEEPAGSCERIIEACHEKDTGSGLAHDCHEAAEAEGATDESCSEQEDECLEGCAAE